MGEANNNNSLPTMNSSSFGCGRKRRHSRQYSWVALGKMAQQDNDPSNHQGSRHDGVTIITDAPNNVRVICRPPCRRPSTITVAARAVSFSRHIMVALLLFVWIQVIPTTRAEEEFPPILLHRNLQFGTPPEEDVTPFPTVSVVATLPAPSPSPTLRPSPSPTLRPSPPPTLRPSPPPTLRPSPPPTHNPTTAPTRRPSFAPTTAMPSAAPITTAPSLAPVPAPTAQPSFAPSTSEPTAIPTVEPSTAVPSPAPSEQPSFSPLATGETRAPSPEPTAAPSIRPSFTPSISSTEQSEPPTPTRFSTVDRTSSPTTTWQPISIARSARVKLELPAGQRASPIGLANIWQNYMEDTLQQTVDSSQGILRIIDILVLVDGQSAANPKNNNNQRLRFLQSQGGTVTQSFTIDTTVEMERNASDPNAGPSLDNQVDELVGNLLSADNLQGALEDAGVDGVRVVEAIEVDPASGQTIKEKPEQWELILGFGLIGICAALLAFTLYSRIKSWRKRRKKRRIAKSRQQNSYVMPKQKRPVPVNTTPERSRDSDIFIEEPSAGPTMYAVQEDSKYLRNLPTTGTSDESSDPFADELKHAVVVDTEAWNEQQQKKEQMRKRGLVVDSLYSNAAGSGEEGVEIGAAGAAATSYPYGEEKQSMSPSSRSSAPTPIQSPAMTQQQLSPENAVTWTAAGVALGMLEQRRAPEDKSVSGFEPYGESKKDTGLRDSWDASDIPDEEFGVYSFMNPLRPRSNDTDNARDSPNSFSQSEDPSSVAVGASMSASSWTEADAADPRASPTEQMIPLGMIKETASESNSDPGDKTTDDSFATAAMLDEVERLSAYVKRYEKKKEVQKASVSGSSVVYNAMSDSVSARRAGGSTDYHQTLSMNNTSMESSGIGNLESSSDLSLGVSYSEDEASTRLGIKRFSIQEPAHGALQYNVEELPIPSIASPQEGDSSRLLSVSGVSMDISHNMPNAPDRPYSPASDIPEDEMSGKLGVSRSPNGKLDAKVNRGKLNKLRGKGNMLDGEERSSQTVPFDEPNRRATKPPERTTNRTPPKIRSNNRGFTNIVSMFESKPKNPITPPHEDWQHGVKTTKK